MKEYPKEYAEDFLKKARKFLDIAKMSYEKYPEEAAFNAIQSVINSNDAFIIFVLNKRASKDHREAILMHKEAMQKTGDSSNLSMVHLALESRDAAGYDVKKYITKQECMLLVKKAEKFLNWVEVSISKKK